MLPYPVGDGSIFMPECAKITFQTGGRDNGKEYFIRIIRGEKLQRIKETDVRV